MAKYIKGQSGNPKGRPADKVRQEILSKSREIILGVLKGNGKEALKIELAAGIVLKDISANPPRDAGDDKINWANFFRLYEQAIRTKESNKRNG